MKNAKYTNNLKALEGRMIERVDHHQGVRFVLYLSGNVCLDIRPGYDNHLVVGIREPAPVLSHE